MKKRYFIAGLIKELGISRKTYYNWEKLEKIPRPKRDPMSGFRYWTPEDIQLLKELTER